MRRNATAFAYLSVVVATFATAPASYAHGVGGMNDETPDFTAPAPPDVESVTVDEKLGAQVPLDLHFRDQDGKDVTLKDLIAGDLPVVLSFNYSNCPMLCNLQLNHFVETLPAILPIEAGRHFKMISVIIEPKEAPSRAAETRTKYLEKLENERMDLRPPAEQGGWTFLVAAKDGDDTEIRKLADVVGVRYHYIPDRAEWAHPAVLVFLSGSGVVTRYVHGINFTADDLTRSVTHAALSEPETAAGFVARCFHYDPPDGASRTAANLMKLTAAVFATMVFAALFLAHFLRRHSRRAGPPASGVS
jgi:protein SCO1/2